ncbi:hypothetical protein V6N12_050770 [Hibiscus sabdariffa]|uniref:Uncharacterized protein n=1 Tax=Hibiscus sabdariffa TaxID=183260 RepID=A0ABR2GDP6_9ROSI
MSAQMTSEYEKYYANIDINVLVFVVVILDSGHKLNYVDWIVRDSCDETKVNLLCLNVKLVLQSLFDAYASSMPSSNISGTSSSTFISLSAFTQSRTQTERKVDLQELMTSKY